MKNIGVKVVYRNKDLEPIYERSYSLKEYTDMIRSDQLRLITDVEDMVYRANDNKPKTEWSSELWEDFCRIKHKLLDKAGDIGRLPENVFLSNQEEFPSLTEFVANIVDKGAI